MSTEPARTADYAHALPSAADVLRAMQRTRPAPDAPRPAWDAWAADLLRQMARFQLLAAVRHGPWGVDGLNQAAEHILRAEGLIPATGDWYPGRPLLVTRNDHALGLMNGDVGLVLALPARFERDSGRPDPGAGTALRVAFAAEDQGVDAVRWVLPARLPAVETVYAMTVHKSQGSEFTHTALVLPPADSPVLTRELLYTGITRARDCFTLVTAAGADAVLARAVARRVLRAGGLVTDK